MPSLARVEEIFPLEGLVFFDSYFFASFAFGKEKIEMILSVLVVK